MGGYGSGRPSRKDKTDGCYSLDINRMQRDGCLQSGWSGNWQWSRDGDEVAQVGFRTLDGRIVLDFRVRLHSGDWEPITQTVPLTYVDCNYGNQRPYFRCPGVVNGVHCGRRVCKLYAGGQYFLCRHCYDLSYNSQSEDRADRALRRANNIRMALGGDPGMAYLIAPKPRGMWHRTYQRKRWEILHYENQANLLFLSKYRHILSQEEREMYFGDIATGE